MEARFGQIANSGESFAYASTGEALLLTGDDVVHTAAKPVLH